MHPAKHKTGTSRYCVHQGYTQAPCNSFISHKKCSGWDTKLLINIPFIIRYQEALKKTTREITWGETYRSHISILEAENRCKLGFVGIHRGIWKKGLRKPPGRANVCMVYLESTRSSRHLLSGRLEISARNWTVSQTGSVLFKFADKNSTRVHFIHLFLF